MGVLSCWKKPWAVHDPVVPEAPQIPSVPSGMGHVDMNIQSDDKKSAVLRARSCLWYVSPRFVGSDKTSLTTRADPTIDKKANGLTRIASVLFLLSIVDRQIGDSRWR